MLLIKPHIFYVIKQVLASKKAEPEFVTTESETITCVTKQCGMLIPFMQPPELTSDTAAKVGIIKHALVECEKKFNNPNDIVVDLDVTSPLRTVKDLENCLDFFGPIKSNTLVNVVHTHKNFNF